MPTGFENTNPTLVGYGEGNSGFDRLVGQPAIPPFSLPRPNDDAIRNAKITIVDAEPAVAASLEGFLQRGGFRNFELIIDASRAAHQIMTSLPDVVLLDIPTVPAPGWEILEALRRDDRTQHIPVLVQTSADDEKTRITAFNLGALDFLSKPIVPTELIARVRNTLSAKIYRDRMTQYSLQLESDVFTDSLTGVANRRAFDYELKRRLLDWSRNRTPLGLILLDIDHFKMTNDRYGHQIGDHVLQSVAKVTKGLVREIDLVARFGGEEFALILPYSGVKEARVVAERVREGIARHSFQNVSQTLQVTASFGITESLQSDDVELLIRRADQALYRAKRCGRNRTYLHDGTKCEPIIVEELCGIRAKTGLPVTAKKSAVAVSIEGKRIAIVDDEPDITAMVQRYLKEDGYFNFLVIHDATRAVDVLREETPDLILLDIRMPKVSGLDILREIRRDCALDQVPVLVFTSASDTETRVESLRLGANDYCEKPLHLGELQVRVRNTLMAREHVESLASHSSELERQVVMRTTELEESRREAIQCLARAAEMRDDNTGRHTIRVGKYAAIIAKEMGFGNDRIVWLEHAAQLHDVGKIGVPDSILMKPGPLTKEEFRVMQRHCAFGSRILRNEGIGGGDFEGEWKGTVANGEGSSAPTQSPLMQMAAMVAESHHERWDGTGYPRGLKGEEIPLEGRITAVADVFDALSTLRPYKKAMSLDQCFTILSENRGSHFDPTVLDAFFRCKSEIIRTYHEYSDESLTAESQ